MKESAAVGILKNIKGIKTTVASDRLDAAEFGGYIDTGSYYLNAACSGTFKHGLPDNKIMGFFGFSGTYKSLWVMRFAAQWLREGPGRIVIWYDSESATTDEMMQNMGIDSKRVQRPDINFVEELNIHLSQFLDEYLKLSSQEQEDSRVMVVIDSVSQYPSKKELTDAIEGEIKQDMTRAKAWASLFRNVNRRLAKARIPMLCTSQAMTQIGAYVPTDKPKGAGESLVFASSIIFQMRKEKMKTVTKGVTEHVGNIVNILVWKSRFTREGRKVPVAMRFDTADLDPYFGLIDLALKYGIFKKSGKMIVTADGTSAFESHIEKDPKKYFTDDVMAKLEAICADEFKFGGSTGGDEDGQVEDTNSHGAN